LAALASRRLVRNRTDDLLVADPNAEQSQSFDHNLVLVDNPGSDEKIFQVSAWFGDNLGFYDNLVFAGPNISPFLLGPICWGNHCSGSNLQMFGNTYWFANNPQPFWWDETQYTSIANWQAATGLDLDSQFVVGPYKLPPELEQFKTEPLTAKIFQQLFPGCGG
jgi:hypothetical protein